MDGKSLTMKAFGALAFSIALTYQIGFYSERGISGIARFDYAFSYWPALILMAAGLVLLTYDFSGCCKPSKAKK